MYVCMYDLFGEPHFDNLDFQSILYIYIKDLFFLPIKSIN